MGRVESHFVKKEGFDVFTCMYVTEHKEIEQE